MIPQAATAPSGRSQPTPAVHYRDPRTGQARVKLFPGDWYVTGSREVLVTVLGSCVAACVRDPVTGIAGMNHFMLPDGDGVGRPGAPTEWSQADRYGSHAMESLINAVLARGARRERLEVKVFGGGRVLAGMTDIGARNAAFVERYLATERLAVLAADLGGTAPRKVYYDAQTGRALVRYLGQLRNETLAQREAHFHRAISEGPLAGPVELFAADGASR